MGIHWAEQAIEIAAPPGACFGAITDYETFSEWQDAVVATDVLDRYDDGMGRRVRVTVDARLRTVTYVLRYHYERPRRVWWDFVEGSGVEQIEGEYLFEPAGSGTLASYRLGIDPGVPVPGFLARRMTEGVMRGSMQDLKAEAERRSAGS